MTSASRRPRASIATLALLGALLALPAPAIAATAVTEEPTPAASDSPPTDAPTPPATTPDSSPDAGTASQPELAPATEPAPEPSVTPAVSPSPTPSPTGPPVVTPSFTVERAWVDPTILDINGRPTVSATMVFPLIDPAVFAVAQGSGPVGLADAFACQVTRPENGSSTITCFFLGTPRPGDSTMSIRVRSEAGDDYQASVPVTMCPLTGCSPLFEVAATQVSAVETCPGEAFTLEGTFDFNVAWNARSASLADGAPEGLTLTASGVRDGSTFQLAGALAEPGAQSIPIVVVDEFGVDHETSVLVTVASPSPTACGALASTGAAFGGALIASLGALALLFGGIVALQRSGLKTSARP